MVKKSEKIELIKDTKGVVDSSFIDKGERLTKSHKYERLTPDTIVPGSDSSINILGGEGGACPTETKTVSARSHLRCPMGHTHKPGDKVFMRHGTTICPKCEMHLERYIPIGE